MVVDEDDHSDNSCTETSVTLTVKMSLRQLDVNK